MKQNKSNNNSNTASPSSVATTSIAASTSSRSSTLQHSSHQKPGPNPKAMKQTSTTPSRSNVLRAPNLHVAFVNGKGNDGTTASDHANQHLNQQTLRQRHHADHDHDHDQPHPHHQHLTTTYGGLRNPSKTTPWPAPPNFLLPLTQTFSFIASHFIMVILIINSFVEDIAHRLGLKVPDPPAVASVLNCPNNSSSTEAANSLAGLPKPVFNRKERSLTAIDDEDEQRQAEKERMKQHRVLSHHHAETGAREDIVVALKESDLLSPNSSVSSSFSGASSDDDLHKSISNQKHDGASKKKQTVSNGTLHSRNSSDGTATMLSADESEYKVGSRGLSSSSSSVKGKSRLVPTKSSTASTTTVLPKRSLESRKCTQDVHDYCAHAGYSCEEYATVTEDGFVLYLHRVGRSDGARGSEYFACQIKLMC
jgi:hypothetical protein